MPLPLLREGSRGQDVTNVQRALNYQLPDAAPPLALDGIFGPKTRARLVGFQKEYGLKPDGIVGDRSRAALFAFVVCSHHLLPRSRPAGGAVVANGFAVADSTSLPPMPPMPRLQLTYPEPFRLPPQMGPPRLEIDPRLLIWLRSRPFEIAAGTRMVFQKGPGAGEVFVDVQATIWSRPFGEHFEAGVVAGVGIEKRINDGHTETSLVVLAKAEVKDVLKLGPVDVAKLQLEGGIKPDPGSNRPPDLTATVKLGPSVETKNGRFTFGVGGYMDYGFNGKEHEIKGGVFVEGAYRF